MSPSAFIVRRVKVDGAWVSSRTARPTNREDRRYVVRYRLHGRELHAGTFTTEATAEARRRWIELQIAEGRGYDIPALLAEPERGATVAEAMQAALDAMPKPSEAQRKRFRNADKQLGRLGPMPVADVRRGDVQKWVNVLAEKYAAATVSQYLVPVRQAFDHAEIVPNPARDPRLRLPLPDDDDEFEPPTLAEFESMVAAARKDVRDVLVVLEGTGMRIKEALALTWGDVDLAGRRLRVARGRTKGRTGGRRFVPLLERVEEALMRQAPPDARQGTVFPALTDNAVRQVMRRACTSAGIAHYHPHDLRGRWISLCLIAGVPIELVRRMAGHRKLSMTLDTYSHVVMAEPEWRLEELRRAVRVLFQMNAGDAVEGVSPAYEGGGVTMEDTGIYSSEP